MNLGTAVAQQNSLAVAASSASPSGASPSSPNALTSLSNNFNSFLHLLLTQLQNQDPTTPMDTNQFTSELVQFSSVEQQISTNGSLTQLIQLTQGSEVIQSASTVGKQATVTSDHIALQNGAGTVNFTTASAEPVAISITDDAGVSLRATSFTSAAGANTWKWDGADNNGAKVADGAYKIAVVGAAAGSAAAALPFTVTGTATGVTNANGTVSLDLGALQVGFGNVQSLGQ